MTLRGYNSDFPLPGMNMLLCTSHLSSYIIESENFVILSSQLLCIELWQKKYSRLNAVYTESIERKRLCLKSLPLTVVFEIDFAFSLPHFLTCRSISPLVNIGKVENDLPRVSAISNWISTGNDSFIFCKGRLDILVTDMMFDEICITWSLVCLCFIASDLVFMNEKRLHHRSRESRIGDISTPISFERIFFRSSHQRCSVRKGALRNFAKFTGLQNCRLSLQLY